MAVFVKAAICGGAGWLIKELEGTSCTKVPSDDIDRDFPHRSAERRGLAYLRVILTECILTLIQPILLLTRDQMDLHIRHMAVHAVDGWQLGCTCDMRFCMMPLDFGVFDY